MKLFLTIILQTSCLAIFAQNIDQQANRYRGDDVVEKKWVDALSVDIQSRNGVWSLEDMELSEKPIVVEYSAAADTLMGLERGNRTYYQQTGKGISIIGSENVQSLVSYDMPETWLRFPMQVGDSVCGYFSGTGSYCDRLFLRRFGTYMTRADAAGKLVLPGGDTLYSVMRLHTERYVGSIVAPIDTLAKQIPVFTADSIISHMVTDAALIREDVYRWYAEGYRYPVLEATTLTLGDRLLSEEMTYCPPEAQEQLVLDEANKKVRARMAEEADNASRPSSKDGEVGGKPAYPYHISRDGEGETVTIGFPSSQSGKVAAMLTNSQGYVYRRMEQADGQSVTLSYSGLRKGQYILHIDMGNEKFAEKFTVK